LQAAVERFLADPKVRELLFRPGSVLTEQHLSDTVYFKYGLYRSFLTRYRAAKPADAVPAQTIYFTNVRRSETREGLAVPLPSPAK
jgi:hypothetical protein